MNLSILILPLAGIGALRLYENALLQQTESELTAQAAIVAAAYKESLLRQFNESSTGFGIESYALKTSRIPDAEEEFWRPHTPVLNLAEDPILPPPPEPLPTSIKVAPEVKQAGRELIRIMREAQQITLAAIRIVDVNAVVVATTGEDLYHSLANRAEVQQALLGKYQSILRQRISDEPTPPLASISRGSRIRVFQTMPIVHQGYILGAVALSRTTANIPQSLYQYRSEIAVAIVILLAMVLAITVITAITLIRPVEAVTRQAQQVARGHSGSVFPLQKPVTFEVSQLSRAVVYMAQHLESRARYIQDFAAQVSHAFKTPLTAMRGAIELLQDDRGNMPEADRNRFLCNLNKDVEYLQNLVQRLLDLARADTIQPGQSSTQIMPIINSVAQRYRCSGFDIYINEPNSDPPVLISAEILESVLENLFDNARQHGGDHLEIGLSQDRNETTGEAYTTITVGDNGPGVSAANADAIFTPFFTTARERGGSGLGLAVTQSLLEAHGGSIELAPDPNGAKFAIKLALEH